MDSQIFSLELNKRVKLAEEIINKHLPKVSGKAATVIDAMNYSVLAGGKRLRPIMILESYRIFSGNNEMVPEVVAAFMSAMECIHTYSLVHDDLPAMDNDEYRRGKETTWKKYGDAMGVLAGDGLLNYAFEIIFESIMQSSSCAMETADDLADKLGSYERAVKAAAYLSKKAGFRGMIGGQCADLEAEGHSENTDRETLDFIHEHKTACLIEAALVVGAILGGADEKSVQSLEECGHDIGVAFQIRDDILDVIGDTGELGKKVGSDEENDKVTYVTLVGLEESEKEVERLSTMAIDIIKDLPGNNEFLAALVESLVGRRK